MDVRNCPKCGSSSISTSSGSKEYSSYTRWSCDTCDWHYQKGSGMGWYDTTGTHPRNLDGEQERLTESGSWCSNCETVSTGEHACTAVEVVEAADEPVPVEDVVSEIESYNRRPRKQIMEDIKNFRIQLTPTFFHAKPWPVQNPDDRYVDKPVEPDIADAIRHEVRECGGIDRIETLQKRLAAESDIEKEFIKVVLSDGVRQVLDDVVWQPQHKTDSIYLDD